MRIIIWIGILLLSFNTWGDESGDALSAWVEGKYLTTQHGVVKGTYLDCQAGKLVEIRTTEGSILVSGVTVTPIEFRDVNQGAIGIPGPMIGFSQRRTTLKEIGDQHFQLKSEHRDCAPMLGKIGCFGKKWRTAAELIVAVFDEDVEGELHYQPFKQVDREICPFIKKQ